MFLEQNDFDFSEGFPFLPDAISAIKKASDTIDGEFFVEYSSKN